MFWNLLPSRRSALPPEAAPEYLTVGSQQVELRFVRHPKARRYLLRLLPDGSARVTIPRGGSAKDARGFAERQTAWLEQQLQRLRERPPDQSAEWTIGTQIFFRGEEVTIENAGPGEVRFGAESIRVGQATSLRAAIQRRLVQLAGRELPLRVIELARQHTVSVSRITVRNQRTRWGSCSRRGAISLNWRLIQTPPFVSDYIILHELMHRRELNHSARFWREVASVCPEYPVAERWLKQHSALLR